MLPSWVDSPSHGRMTKLHIRRGHPPLTTTTTTTTHTHLCPTNQQWETLNDKVRNFEVESQKNTHILIPLE